jgi:hypothetical protein
MVVRPVVGAESPGRAAAVVEIFAWVITALSRRSMHCKLFEASSVPAFRLAPPELNSP